MALDYHTHVRAALQGTGIHQLYSTCIHEEETLQKANVNLNLNDNANVNVNVNLTAAVAGKDYNEISSSSPQGLLSSPRKAEVS